MMLVDRFDLEAFTPPCELGAERHTAVDGKAGDVSEAFPYLNATLRGAIYNRAANALTFLKAHLKDKVRELLKGG